MVLTSTINTVYGNLVHNNTQYRASLKSVYNWIRKFMIKIIMIICLAIHTYIYIYMHACTPYELACTTTKFKYACVRVCTNTHTHSTLHERHTHHRSYINAHTCTFLLAHCINNNWAWSMIWLVGPSDGNYYAKSGSRLRFYNSAVGEHYNYFNNIIFYLDYISKTSIAQTSQYSTMSCISQSSMPWAPLASFYA